jgi:hypothetical protein
MVATSILSQHYLNQLRHFTFAQTKPPVLDEITGTQAMASKAAKPKLSASDGITNKSATGEDFFYCILLT